MIAPFARSGSRLAPLAAMLALLTGPSLPARAADPPPPLDARARAEVIDGVSAELERTYVEADTAKLIAAALKRRLKAGAYDKLSDRFEFAQAVTTDLRSVNGDLHLSLRPAGPGGAAGGARVVVRGGPAPAGGSPGQPVIRTGPGGTPAPGNRPIPGMPNPLERNFGLEKLEILPGNVGYLEVTGFMGAAGSDEAIATALRFLERTDAVIIDVRRNGGGSGQMSHMLFSHFLPADSIPTIRIASRTTPEPVLMRSFVDVPGPRRPDVPLYVLTSRRTGSAAEEFSFVLRNLSRATLVGERTSGAGHMVDFRDVPRDFVLGVSITRVSDPRTGREWEGVGVAVDRAVEAQRALSVAHEEALTLLASRATDPERKRKLEWAADWVRASGRPQPEAAEQARLAGAFSEDREIAVKDGKLVYHRGPFSETLQPLGDARYMLAPETRLVFESGAPSPGFTIERLDGSRTQVVRRPAAAGQRGSSD